MADASLERREQGRLLIGGAPLRFLRLSSAGATMVGSWLDEGAVIGPGAGSQALARRLLGAGMAHPEPPPLAEEPDLCVVIPVKDDQYGLDTTLGALAGRWPVVVVDDGSVVPIVTAGARGGIRLIRRAVAGGPGVARQDGLRAVDSALVAFVDAGVEVGGDDLGQLCRWLADSEAVAVGPRVASRPASGPLARYEQRRSPLDLGRMPASVGPGRPVAYLPSACLLVRSSALAAVGPFDHDLRYGEDVDLVWRLLRIGTVRYEPSIVALHPARETLRALMGQRLGYGSSAAPLAARHGPRVAPVRMSGWSLAGWTLVLSGRPLSALVLAGGTAAALTRKLAPVLGDDRLDAVGLTFRGHWAAGGSLADASVRDWWPLTALLALTGRRRVAAGLVALATLRRWRGGPTRFPDAALDAAIGAADNLAYGTGVWQGAMRQRSIRCLLPHLTSWPGQATDR